jgi:alkanesulfonate monooxygenase SsuD/methylene tetrahydromethanopterin reductase-like flavin-dependent oxidoreductase (luciferase family)
MLEAYTLLSAVAARTARIQLGAMVTGVTYRNPAFLAKVVTTLDVVSSGRAILGIGAAWNDEESLAFGYPWPSATERFERLEDALRICRSMFTEQESTVHGTIHHVEGAINVPQPIRPGGPPILVGGGGERKTLRLTARYADMWNGFGDIPMIRHKLDVLSEHCATEGRDRSEILATRLGTLIVADTHEEADRRRREWQTARGVTDEGLAMRLTWGDRAEVVEQASAFLDAGLQGVLFNMPAGSSPDDVSRAGESLSALR